MIKRKKALLGAIVAVAFGNAVGLEASAQQMDVVQQRTSVKMEVNTASLTVRAGGSTKYSILGYVKKGTILDVISVSNGWAKINFNGKTGYVSSSYLKKITTVNKIQMTVKTDDLNVRKGSSTKYSILGKLNKGDVVTVVETLSNGWVKIEYKGGFGYVSNVKGAYLELYKPEAPSTPEGSTTKYSANAHINLRKTASWSGQIIEVVKKDEVVEVISIENNWAKAIFNGNTGYVPATHITKVETSTPSEPEETPNPDVPSTPEEAPMPETAREMTVKVDTLSVRTGSSTSFSKLGELKKGEVVIGLETLSNGWVKIMYEGQVAYISNVKGAYLQEGPLVKDRESANEVIELIKTIDKTITLEDKEEVASVREAYDKLNASAKSLVTNIDTLVNAEKEIVRLEEELGNEELNKEKADAVIALIDALNNTITLGDKDSVVKAREAYDKLNVNAKALVTNLNKLVEAETEIAKLEKEQTDIETSAEVVSLIKEIEDLSGSIELDNKELISRARMAYNNLSPEAKALVSSEVLRVLEEAEVEIKRLEDEESANIVKGKIELLNRDIVITDQEVVKNTRAEFEKLSPEAQALVSNINVLELAEEKITEKKQKYSEVIDLIGAIPVTVELQHKTQVEEARNAFDSLDEDIRNYITTTAQEHYQILTRAEEEIARLEAGGTTPEVDPVKSIQDKINSLMEKELTLDDKETVVKIRQEYNALSDDLKPQILVGVIEEFEMQIEGLEAVKSIQDKIDALKKNGVTIDDKETVVKIRQEYTNLRSELKSKISETDIEELEKQMESLEYAQGRFDEEQMKAYEQKTANVVMDKINKLNKELVITDYTSILEARKEYDKLYPDAKALVTNLSVLEEAEAKIAIKKERYERAMNLIADLPEDITLEHEAQVKEARDAFDVLEEDEKQHAMSFKLHYQILTNAEETIARLKAENNAI